MEVILVVLEKYLPKNQIILPTATSLAFIWSYIPYAQLDVIPVDLFYFPIPVYLTVVNQTVDVSHFLQ